MKTRIGMQGERLPRILVVDDEERNLDLIEAIIEIEYIEEIEDIVVLRAESGPRALECLDVEEVDVVLLDVMMPKMDGYEVARRIRANDRTRDLPIVMVTALSDVEERVRAIDAGADDFITKPVEPVILLARVRSLLQVKAHRDEEKNRGAWLEEEVEHRTADLKRALEELSEASMETIYRLSRATEYRDTDTGAHIVRMSHHAASIARKMGLDEATTINLLHAAPLHDIGKIGIPDQILLKPGKLDAKEFDLMEQHTTMGGQILEGAKSAALQMGRDIALSHHEKWDGSGYPAGLSGTDIPFVGRVSAVADFFDALTSSRPYRKEPVSVEATLELLSRGRGSHFDPEVVDAFFAVQTEITATMEANRDDGVSFLHRIAGFTGEDNA